MNKLIILSVGLLSFALACHQSCNCGTDSYVCNTCRLDFIGSEIDGIKRTCPCPPGWFTTVKIEGEYDQAKDCSYDYGYGQYSDGCYNDCKDFATLDEAKIACNLDSLCKAITYSFKKQGGKLSTDAIIGANHGYQLRGSATGKFNKVNKENSWFKSDCPDPLYANDPCDFDPQQGYQLAGCVQDCKDFNNLADAQKACRLDNNCGGVTFSRKELGGKASTSPWDGVWGFQLRAIGSCSQSKNGENSWKKVNCNSYSYDQAEGQYSKGCANHCKDYATLDEAKIACDADDTCQAVTYSYATIGGSLSTNAISGYSHGYQLRSSNTGLVNKPNKENSWIKGKTPIPKQYNYPCDYSPSQGVYLANCIQNCQDYATLTEAQQACRADPNCGGVTFSRSEIGGSQSRNAFDGVWGYQIRAGNTFVHSPHGENAWRKIPCPTQPFSCTKLIDTDQSGNNVAIIMNACQLEIGLKIEQFQVSTDCCFQVDKVGDEDRSYVTSSINLNINQCSFSRCCLAQIKTQLQYQNPSSDSEDYINLPSRYYTVGDIGSINVEIPLIDIFQMAYQQNVNKNQIVQVVKLQLLIGHTDKYLRQHRWQLIVYTNRNEVEVFAMDINILTDTGSCSSGDGNCVVVADLDTIGEVVSDDSFTCVKHPPFIYSVGDMFYARISFADSTYTKQLRFVNLFFKNDINQVFNFSEITTAFWSNGYLDISLPLVEPSQDAIIQINMVINPYKSMRFLQDATQTQRVQFTTTVNGNATAAAAAAEAADAKSNPASKDNGAQNVNSAQSLGSSCIILLFGLNWLAVLLLLL